MSTPQALLAATNEGTPLQGAPVVAGGVRKGSEMAGCPPTGRGFTPGRPSALATQGGSAGLDGAEARSCLPMPQHSVVESLRMAFSTKSVLGFAPVEADNPAISWRSAKVGGPARPCGSWDRGPRRHAPVPVRPYLSRFIASLASADAPVAHAAAATAEDASGCVTHTSTTTGCPGRYRSRSPHWESRWERGGKSVVAAAPSGCAAAAASGGAGGGAAGVQGEVQGAVMRGVLLRWPLRWP